MSLSVDNVEMKKMEPVKKKRKDKDKDAMAAVGVTDGRARGDSGDI